MTQPYLPDLTGDVVALAAALVDIPSVSGQETPLADAIEESLRACRHLQVDRDGDAIVARTGLEQISPDRPGLGRQRVIIAGHIDTVPVAENVPGKQELRQGNPVLWGRGSVDMKSGVAVQLHLAARLADPRYDLTWVFYDHEEVQDSLNGLGRLVQHHPDWLAGDFAILGEPTSAGIEGGCNGTIRVQLIVRGRAAHSARAWKGVNAIHRVGHVLERLNHYEPRVVRVDGLDYRESLSAVWIEGGIATNSIPDECTVTVNYRFAPSTNGEQALAHIQEVFAGLDPEIIVTDLAEGARPGLDSDLATGFVSTVLGTGSTVGPKYGWTDVARFSKLGIPAVNFGPGDPELCHTADENCPISDIYRCAEVLEDWLQPRENSR